MKVEVKGFKFLKICAVLGTGILWGGGGEDTSAKDIAWEGLKLAEPDYRALESRNSEVNLTAPPS